MSDSSFTNNSSFTNDGYVIGCDIGHDTNDTVQPGELESLIQVLEDKINIRDPTIRSIKYPQLLISSLIELNYLVGMDRLKDSIALQVMRLIDGAKNGERSGRMLNTILYGPPGVGKTKVGIILAKIWYSLGYLKKPTPKATGFNFGQMGNTNPTINTTTISGGGSGDMSALIPIVLLILFYGFTYLASGASYVYSRLGWAWLLGLVFLILAIFIILYWNQTSYNYITKIVNTTQETHDPKINGNIKDLNDRDLIKVVSRQDFVAEYLGQTAPKTKALLQANLGKVLFIDEAYSLYNGERDQFGMEALTTLNLFMSENPDGIAVIFAGYKDLMKYGVFKVQPGLPRRCMWHFECTGYNGDQLADIFYRQVYKDGWAIRKCDYGNIRNIIKNNSDMFTSYGGDTERLLFYSQLEASRSNVMAPSYSCSGSYNSSNSNSNNNTYDYNANVNSLSQDNRKSRSRINRRNGKSRYNRKSSESSDDYRSTETKINKYNGKILTYEHVQHGLRRLEENNINDN